MGYCQLTLTPECRFFGSVLARTGNAGIVNVTGHSEAIKSDNPPPPNLLVFQGGAGRMFLMYRM